MTYDVTEVSKSDDIQQVAFAVAARNARTCDNAFISRQMDRTAVAADGATDRLFPPLRLSPPPPGGRGRSANKHGLRVNSSELIETPVIR